MTETYFFQYNIPADNQFSGQTDRYINILATWDGSVYNDGTPMVHIAPANLSFYDCIAVKNWYKAKCDIEKIAQDHFAEQAKQERIAKARAELIAAGEFNNPVLDRYSNIDPFFTKIINNHFTPVS